MLADEQRTWRGGLAMIAVCCGLVGLGTADERKPTATLTGRVLYDGKAPVRRRMLDLVEPAVGLQRGLTQKSLDDSLIVGKNGGIANVFIYMRGKGIKFDASSSRKGTVRVFVEHGQFKPHALAMQTTQQLLLDNTSREPLNFNGRFNKNEPFNVLIAARDGIRYRLRDEFAPIPIQSNVRPWMQAWLLVVDHPFFAITDDSGHFSIEGLPVGEWEFRVWHEKVGLLASPPWPKGKITVDLKPGHNHLDDLKIQPRAFDKVKASDRPITSATRAAAKPPAKPVRVALSPPTTDEWFRHPPFPELGFPQVDRDYWQYVRLASHRAAQDELRISKSQRDRINAVNRQMLTEHKQVQEETRGLSTGERTREFNSRREKVYRRAEERIEKTLSASQHARIHELRIQRYGHAVFFYEPYATQIGIDGSLKTLLRKKLHEHFDRLKKLDVETKQPAGSDPETRRLTKLRKSMLARHSYRRFWDEARAVLSSEQEDKLQRLRGPVVDAAVRK